MYLIFLASVCPFRGLTPRHDGRVLWDHTLPNSSLNRPCPFRIPSRNVYVRHHAMFSTVRFFEQVSFLVSTPYPMSQVKHKKDFIFIRVPHTSRSS